MRITVSMFLFWLCESVAGAAGACQSAFDPDGDGWGFENGSSCRILPAGMARCSGSNSDPDGDGWGWEKGATCILYSAKLPGGFPDCSSSVADPDGDGYGWENNQTCTAAGNNNPTDNLPVCSQASADPDGDGYGWENGRTCKSAGSQPDGMLACVSPNADPDGDGWGWESGRTCKASGNNDNRDRDINNTAGKPSGVHFRSETLRRVGAKGDNWCHTWAHDDSIIVSMDDGDWFGGTYKYHNRLYRMNGGRSNFSVQDMPGYPRFHTDDDGWFGYGILSVNGVWYSMVSKTQFGAWSEGPFRGVKMLRSYDSGNSWSRVDRYNNDRAMGSWDSAVQSTQASEMFFGEESGRTAHGKTAYPFSFVTFVQNGKDHRASKDGYVYIYSPEGSRSNQLLLARVQESQLGSRDSWQYFSGWQGSEPRWTSDINARQPNLYLPAQNSRGEYFGFYSWLPSVVWNPGLQMYIMVNGGTYAGHGMSSSKDDYYNKWMHTKTGSLGFWYSETPYGPWQQFYYNDYWTADNPANLTYQPKLSPKWISADGKTMTLVWSDAMRNKDGYSHSINYKWNQMDIELQLK